MLSRPRIWWMVSVFQIISILRWPWTRFTRQLVKANSYTLHPSSNWSFWDILCTGILIPSLSSIAIMLSSDWKNSNDFLLETLSEHGSSVQLCIVGNLIRGFISVLPGCSLLSQHVSQCLVSWDHFSNLIRSDYVYSRLPDSHNESTQRRGLLGQTCQFRGMNWWFL